MKLIGADRYPVLHFRNRGQIEMDPRLFRQHVTGEIFDVQTLHDQ